MAIGVNTAFPCVDWSQIGRNVGSHAKTAIGFLLVVIMMPHPMIAFTITMTHTNMTNIMLLSWNPVVDPVGSKFRPDSQSI